MRLKAISANQLVGESQRQLVMDTPNDNTFGIWRAPSAPDSDNWLVYLETNGDPVMLPHAGHGDCDELMSVILRDAGVTIEQLTGRAAAKTTNRFRRLSGDRN